jgi:hypothetical protein
MKPLLFLLGIFLCLNSTAQVNKEALFIGKSETDILKGMQSDETFHYLSLNKESDTSYHLTYSRESVPAFCNFYIEYDTCKAVIFYYPPEQLPQVIIQLNSNYKRVDKTTWVDSSLTYTINMFLDDPKAVRIGFKKM